MKVLLRIRYAIVVRVLKRVVILAEWIKKRLNATQSRNIAERRMQLHIYNDFNHTLSMFTPDWKLPEPEWLSDLKRRQQRIDDLEAQIQKANEALWAFEMRSSKQGAK